MYQRRLDIAPEGLGTPLYDMSARFYAPGNGAFTQLDTVMGKVQDPLSMNRFLYAEANPATLTDPTGHFAFLALLIPVAIGFFAGAGVDAGVQQVTTGTVDWGQAAFSGAIGAASGGVGGVAAAGAKSLVVTGIRSVAGTAAKPIVTRAATIATGAVVQTAVDQAITTAAVPPNQRDTNWVESAAVSATTQAGTEVVNDAARSLRGRLGGFAVLCMGWNGDDGRTPVAGARRLHVHRGGRRPSHERSASERLARSRWHRRRSRAGEPSCGRVRQARHAAPDRRHRGNRVECADGNAVVA
jgi:RHS repeat-associated protein